MRCSDIVLGLCIAILDNVGYSLIAGITRYLDNRRVHTTMMHIQGRTTRELAALRQVLDKLTAQVNALVSYVAEQPQPPRANWERHSSPAFVDTNPSIETKVVRSVRPPLKALPRRIMRVTLCLTSQWVNSYDADNNKIPEYCGSLPNVRDKILAREPYLSWELVKESA